MKFELRSVLNVLVIFFSGCTVAITMLLATRFIPVGQDHSQEATVGVISKHGLPFPFAFDAPGYSRTQFDSAAAIVDCLVYLIVVMGLVIVIKPKRQNPEKF